MGTITFHPGRSGCPDTDHPTNCASTSTRNLEPGSLRRAQSPSTCSPLLDELGLVGYPKTSGGRGVHVFLRIRPDWDFVAVRRAGIALAREIERRAPDGDHLLVEGGAWPAALHRLQPERARPHLRRRVLGACHPIATVSTPLTWEELAGADPDDYTMATVPRWSPSAATRWRAGSGLRSRSIRCWRWPVQTRARVR